MKGKNNPDLGKRSSNRVRDFYGLKDSDHLIVAGFYMSVEDSPNSNKFNNFCVKKADYVAEKLQWYDFDGKVDVDRAKYAINNACQTMAPNRLRYMYRVKNKDKRLTDKGGNYVLMSAKRWLKLQEEEAKSQVGGKTKLKDEKWRGFQEWDKPKPQEIQNLDTIIEQDNQNYTPPEVKISQQDFDCLKKVAKQALFYWDIGTYTNEQLNSVIRQLLQSNAFDEVLEFLVDCQDNENFNLEPDVNYDYYEYCYPEIKKVFDLVNKYDALKRWLGWAKEYRAEKLSEKSNA